MSSNSAKRGGSQPPRRRRSGLLRVRRRTKAATGAVVLSGLTVALIVLSYRTGNILFQFDSIVCFLAAIVLLFRDTSHTVQVRVVNRILASSHELVTDLSAYGLGGSSFLYVPEGRKVGDVMLVPLKESETISLGSPTERGEAGIPASSGGSANPKPSGGALSELRSVESAPGKSADLKDAQKGAGGPNPAVAGEERATTAISNLKFAPPGRAMAELFLRESALKDPNMEQVIAAIPETMVAGFQLADSVSVKAPSSGDEAVEVTLVHPVLAGGCRASKDEGTGIVGCEVCSMMAVLFSSSTGRLVSLDGCVRGESIDTSTTSLHLGAKYPAD